MRFGGWLAGARHWHFALGWFLIGNGIIYLLYMGARGEWRRRVFQPGRDTRHALLMMAYYLRLRRTSPPIVLYNGLHRVASSSGIPIRPGEGLSGLCVFKP